MSVAFRGDVSERVSALVLYGGFARDLRAPDYPLGADDETTGRRGA